MASGAQADARSSRRRFLIGLGAVAGTGVVATGYAATRRDDDERPPQRTKGPNVLYVTADDLGTRLGAYGHDLVSSPRIDAFAEQALLFERAYAQIAICGASRASILTGLRPETTGIGGFENWQEAAPGAVTLVKQFRNAGYRTYGVGKIEDERNGPLDDPWDLRLRGNRGNQPTEALALLGQLADDGGGPWFAAIGFHQPHCPWNPTVESMDRYVDVDVLPEAGPQRRVFADFIPQCTPETRPQLERGATGQVVLTEAEVSDIVERYLASVTDIDTMFGNVLDRAEELGLLDDTIVIFWSGDHGFQLGDNGWGKWTCFDAATRIPLIVQLPGKPSAGKRAVGLVEAVDMYPTLVELCGLGDPPQELDGVSFAPLFGAPERSWKSAAFNTYGRDHSVKTERYDLIVRDGSDVIHLYDLVEDPDELVDLAASRPDLVAELRATLDAGPDAARPTP